MIHFVFYLHLSVVFYLPFRYDLYFVWSNKFCIINTICQIRSLLFYLVIPYLSTTICILFCQTICQICQIHFIFCILFKPLVKHIKSNTNTFCILFCHTICETTLSNKSVKYVLSSNFRICPSISFPLFSNSNTACICQTNCKDHLGNHLCQIVCQTNLSDDLYFSQTTLSNHLRIPIAHLLVYTFSASIFWPQPSKNFLC